MQKAYADFDAGTIDNDALVAAQDKAAEDSVRKMAQTGEKLLSDGEQRASSFATYPIIDTLGGAGLASNLAADGQYFAIFDDGHHRQLPRLTKGPFKYKTYAYENFKKSAPYAEGTGHAMKSAVIAPSMLYLLYPLNGSVEGYSREEFVKDLVNECEKDIRGCFEAGAKRVSIDFTEGRLASKKDSRNPWTGAELLKTFVDLNNQVEREAWTLKLYSASLCLQSVVIKGIQYPLVVTTFGFCFCNACQYIQISTCTLEDFGVILLSRCQCPSLPSAYEIIIAASLPVRSSQPTQCCFKSLFATPKFLSTIPQLCFLS